MPNEFNGLTYIEEQTSFLKSDGKYGYNVLIKVPNPGLVGYKEAFFFDIYSSDENFGKYKDFIQKLEESGYLGKFVRKDNIRTPQFYRFHDDPLGGRYL